MVPPCYRHRIFSFEVIPSKLNNITSQCVFSNFLSFSFLTFDVAIHQTLTFFAVFRLPPVYTFALPSATARSSQLFKLLLLTCCRIYPHCFTMLWSSPRTISTGQLHTLLHFHLRPIYDIVYIVPYSLTDERSYLRESFTLRCFQRLSRPHVATLLCRWHDNRCTRGASIPVLSY